MLSIQVGYSQITSPEFSQIISPSPEAASLGKYGDYPISYNTGTPNIAIPLYEIKGKEISMPLTLNYDSRGNKVESVASWLGLGWTLNAGGVITKVVKGLSDNSSHGYFNRYPDFYTLKDQTYDLSNYADHPKYTFEKIAAEGNYDLLPDVYYFNFGSYTGTISFKYVENSTASFKFQPIINPAQDLKIEHPYDGAGDNWVITTPEGVKYYFNEIETTVTTSSSTTASSSGTYTSAWYLSDIESTNSGDFFHFSYQSDVSGPMNSMNNEILTTMLDKREANFSSECNYPIAADSPNDKIAGMTTHYLTSINYSFNTTNQITISLSSSADNRCDEITGYSPKLRRLDNLLVVTGQKVLANYTFEYDKFGNSTTCNSSNRLQLKKVIKSGFPPYLFEYNTIDLPEYMDMKDHWGYWNGSFVPANNSFVPKLPVEYEALYINNGIPVANRESDNVATLAGLLKKIIFPTGGYTEFDFEPHLLTQFKDNYHLSQEVNGTAYSDEISHGTMNIEESYHRNLWSQGDFTLVGGDPNVRGLSFTLDESQNVQIQSSINPTSGTYAEPTGIRLYKLPYNDVYDNLAFNNNAYTTLEAGDYFLAISVAEELIGVSANASVAYYEVENNYYKESIVGGARVKSIASSPSGLPEDEILTEFKYYLNYIDELKNNGQTPVTSGWVFQQPVYFYTNICGELFATSMDTSPLGLYRGYHVGYSEVAEIKKTKNKIGEISGIPIYEYVDNGYTVYKFNNSSNPDRRSKTKEIALYNNSFDLLSTTQFEYGESYYPENNTGNKIKINQVDLIVAIPGHLTEYFYHFGDYISPTHFNFPSLWTPQSKKTEIYYDGQDPQLSNTIETRYEYYTDGYDLMDQTHYQLKKSEIIKTSNNDVLIKNYGYPPEFAVTNSIFDQMTTANIYSTPVEQTTIRTDQDANGNALLPGKIVSASSLEYDKFGNYFRPHKRFEYNTDTQTKEYRKKYTYNQNNGNIKDIMVVSGIDERGTSVIWDTEGLNIIAKVANATRDEIGYYSFEDIGSNDWTYSGSAVISDQQPISGINVYQLTPANTISFSGSQLIGTSFKVSLMAKNGTVSINGQNFESQSAWSNVEVSITSFPLVITGTAMVDEIRIFPGDKKVIFETYSTERFVGYQSRTDANGKSVFYEYDDLGRLVLIKNHKGEITKTFKYNYRTETN